MQPRCSRPRQHSNASRDIGISSRHRHAAAAASRRVCIQTHFRFRYSSLPLSAGACGPSEGCFPVPYNDAAICRWPAAPSTKRGRLGCAAAPRSGRNPCRQQQRRRFLSARIRFRAVGTSATCLSKCRRDISRFLDGPGDPKIIDRRPDGRAVGQDREKTTAKRGGRLVDDDVGQDLRVPNSGRSRTDRREVSWLRAPFR